MYVKKVIAVMAILLLVLSLTTACGVEKKAAGGSDEAVPAEQPAKSDDSGTVSETGDAEVKNPNATPEMDFDLGGKTITVVSWWNMEITGEDPDSIQCRENLEALMKKHNFKVEYIAIDYGEYQEKIVASLTAGQPLGDIVRVGKAYAIPALVKRDLLWPVDEYTKNDKVFNQKVTYEFSLYEGRGYGFSEVLKNMSTGMYYNRTLEKRLGLKPLQEYVDSDTWTWETFIKVSKEANQDTNNDGKLDTWGLATGSFLEQALAANATDLIDGRKQNLENSKVIETFNFISRLYTEGVPRPTEGGDWTEPRHFFVQGNTLMYAGADWEANGLKNDMANYDVGFLPFPKGPSATTYHACEPLAQFLTISKVIKNPEQLLYIWEKTFDIESVDEYPGQGEIERTFDNEDDINNARIAGENMRITDSASYPSSPFWEIIGDLTQGVSVSTIIEKYKDQFQAAIDEVYAN